MDAQEQEKKLKLMKFWLVGTFAILFAAFTFYFGVVAKVLGVVANTGGSVFGNMYYWLFIAIIAVLTVAVWFGYKSYLNKK